MLAQPDAASVDLIEDLLQLERRDDPPAVERIDDHLAEVAAELHEKAPRQGDPGGLGTDAARQLEIENRQRDRQPGVAVEHLAHQRAARVVVVIVLAVEAFFLEELTVDRLDHPLDVVRSAEPRRDRLAPRADLAQVTFDVDARLVFGGDQQRRFDEIDPRLRERGDLTKPLPRYRRMYQNPRLHDSPPYASNPPGSPFSTAFSSRRRRPRRFRWQQFARHGFSGSRKRNRGTCSASSRLAPRSRSAPSRAARGSRTRPAPR